MNPHRLAAPLVSLLALSAPAVAGGQDLDALLAKGPIVSVESDSAGKFASATAVIAIERSADEVWAVASDLARHKEIIPKLLESAATPVAATASTPPGAKVFDVEFEVEAPGGNPSYRMRFEVDPALREMKGQWRKGDLKGSRCRWKLVPAGERRTLLFYTTATKNFSSLVAAIEDDQQTITVGVNVSSALAVVKAVKSAAETRPPQAPRSGAAGP